MHLNNIFLVYRSDSDLAKKEAIKCIDTLESLGIKVSSTVQDVNNNGLKDLLSKSKELPDLGVVLGGDGTVLRAARHFSIYNIPIINFNVGGNLGFLTHEHSLLKSKYLWEKISQDHFIIEKRMMLHATLSSKCQKDFSSSNSYWALNDFYFRSYRDDISPTCNLELEIDEERVNECRGDGLIVSTPTGSTAYALATGGPILHPSIDAIIVSPICPMSLSSRPIVIPGSSKIVIKAIGNKNQQVKLWQDGISGDLTEPGDKCIIQKSNHKALIVILEKNPSYYRTLTQKLHWTGSLNNPSSLLQKNNEC